MPKKNKNILFNEFDFDMSTYELCQKLTDYVCENYYETSLGSNLLSISFAGALKEKLSYSTFDVSDLQKRLTCFIISKSTDLLEYEEKAGKTSNCDLTDETETFHLLCPEVLFHVQKLDKTATKTSFSGS